MIETEVPEPRTDIWYEACPDCWDTDPILEGGCLTCFDLQLVPHDGCEIE